MGGRGDDVIGMGRVAVGRVLVGWWQCKGW